MAELGIIRRAIGRVSRWWDEQLVPELKCRRKGHALRTEARRYYRRPKLDDFLWSRFVAIKVVEERQVCRRCDHATEWAILYSKSLNGISLPLDKMETLEREGRVYV